MKKSLIAAAVALAAVALPLTVQAHRAWILPSTTIASGEEAWVGFDAGMSNDVFNADHAAMNIDALVITAPDGSTVQAENVAKGRYRTTFDVHLTQQGTYKIANVRDGFSARYTLNGETKSWRGAEADFPAALPEGATDVQPTRSAMRVETFVTLGAPTDDVFAPTGRGIELVPITHPADLVVGEPATFKLLNGGQPAAGMTVTIAQGGKRHRDDVKEFTVETDAEGVFTATWESAGMFWINAAQRTEAANGQPTVSVQYNGIVEVLP